MSSEVQTPFGPKRLGDISLDDKICDPFGGVQFVSGIVDWPDWPVWRVHFSDGTSVDVAPEHEWTGFWSNDGIQVREGKERIRLKGMDGALKLETRYIKACMESGRKRRTRFRIPLCEPVPGNFNRYDIDPYLLGAFIGDGRLSEDSGVSMIVHADDRQILEEVATACEPLRISPDTQKPHLLRAYIPTDTDAARSFKRLKLMGKRAWEKFLPPSSSWCPVEWRWSLLQGLMDTDGWVEEKRCAFYCTTSPRLRDDVARLARSLGCFVTITDKHPTYTYKGKKLDGRPAWALRIKSATPEKLFRLKRKRDIASRLKHQSLAKVIVKIEDTGRRETLRCISVSHPTGLYLTDDYTVTHNSDGVLGHWAGHEARHGKLAVGLIMRTEYEQLRAIRTRARALFEPMGAVWRAQDRMLLFPSGAVLMFRHAKTEDDAAKYQGWEVNWLCLEELGEWPAREVFVKLYGILRDSHGVPCWMIATGNPGGVGHNWVKAEFIDAAAPFTPFAARDEDDKPLLNPDGSPVQRVFIPAKVWDNRILLDSDPGYVSRLQRQGKHPAKAWIDGDWEVGAGGVLEDGFGPPRPNIKLGTPHLPFN
ncbi:MAG: hypothetical protein OXC14_17240, partial [Rhodospirillaceae bacterium]|nr:hypothetical protein [Rhodospirillaceae bacterium]